MVEKVSERQERLRKNPAGLFLELEICYKDGSEDRILSDESWQVSESSTRFSEIYDGEVYDASFVSSECWFLGYYITFASINYSENKKERRRSVMISKIIDAIKSYSWDIQLGVVSIMLFGEYPIPKESDFE